MEQHNEILYREWAHAPSHLFVPGGAYIITAGTYRKTPLFNSPDKREFLMQSLFAEAERWGWSLQAWAIMANHYHFVALTPEQATTLPRLITSLHSKTAIWLNKTDGAPGRKVWFQYWDTRLTYQHSYLARLNYVHHNPAKHGLVEDAENYRWCSMGWFTRNATAGFRQTVLSFKYDLVRVEDNF
ncbi:MAG: transposase [Chloroflexi bacterium]|nr:transposase [Chloroflexota bacterium]MCL5107356.1 transposase [Chloroflexota bacterium]